MSAVVAFPLRVVRVKPDTRSAAAIEDAQYAACERWEALSASQRFRRQRHRIVLWQWPVVYAGGPPEDLRRSDKAFDAFTRARGKFLAQLSS